MTTEVLKTRNGKEVNIDTCLECLESKKGQHLALADYLIKHRKKYGGKDLILLAAINRSLSVLSGFLALWAIKNYICAAPLVRSQLDTAMRLAAFDLVKDQKDFAKYLSEGNRIDKYKDRDGNLLKDWHLREHLHATDGDGWINNAYEHTSGLVHFSNHAVDNILKLHDDEKKIEIFVTDTHSHIHEQFILEMVVQMVAATQLVMGTIDRLMKEEG